LIAETAKEVGININSARLVRLMGRLSMPVFMIFGCKYNQNSTNKLRFHRFIMQIHHSLHFFYVLLALRKIFFLQISHAKHGGARQNKNLTLIKRVR